MSESHVVLRTGRVDIVPGETFQFNGKTYEALTYPHGAGKRIEPYGIYMDYSPPYDPDIYTPDVGELTAIEVEDKDE